ncbi:unnamed protein product [Choristocarpus tenellus]
MPREQIHFVLGLVASSGFIRAGRINHLQLTSLAVCNECRPRVGFHAKVELDTPAGILASFGLLRRRKSNRASRIPALCVNGLEWDLNELALFSNQRQTLTIVGLPTDIPQLSVGDRFDRVLDRVLWPTGLQVLRFGDGFNQAVDGVKWPSWLRQHSFGRMFNQPVNGVAWPAEIKELTFGDAFNEAVDEVVWPTGL